VAARAPGVASPRRASGASRLAVATWGVIVVLGISGPPVHGPAPLVLAPAAAQRTVTGAPVAVPTAVSTAVPTTEPLPPPVPAPAAEMQPATFTSDLPDGRARIAIITAMAQIGLPYVWGGNGPTAGDAGFDCSGLSTFAYAAAGVALPRTAHTQYYAGPHVPADAALQPGDLVFYGTSGPTSHHVGLYIGNGQMIHAPNPSTVVKYASIYSMSDLLPYGGRPS
jgi:cell wall-associated NlpC family hydrolase